MTYNRKRYEAHREQALLRSKRYYDRHKDEINARVQQRREADPERFREYARNWARKNPGKTNELAKAYQQRARYEAIAMYGGPICVCCGETEYEFLTIDHINGGGQKHRKMLGGRFISVWLRKNGYPDGFRILCMNCNFVHRFGRACPHERPNHMSVEERKAQQGG